MLFYYFLTSIILMTLFGLGKTIIPNTEKIILLLTLSFLVGRIIIILGVIITLLWGTSSTKLIGETNVQNSTDHS
jgi:hypothetical protein